VLGDSIQQLEHFARSSVTVEESMPMSEYYPELNSSLVRVIVFIIHCEITLHISDALCTHHQEYIKIVNAVTGTNHVSVWCRFKTVKRCPRSGVYFTMSWPS